MYSQLNIESFNNRKSDYAYLDSAYNAAFAKLFSSYDKSVINCCQFYYGVLPFSMRIIDIRRLQFYANLSSTNSDTLLSLYLLSGKQEYDNLLSKHGLTIIGDIDLIWLGVENTFGAVLNISLKNII